MECAGHNLHERAKPIRLYGISGGGCSDGSRPASSSSFLLAALLLLLPMVRKLRRSLCTHTASQTLAGFSVGLDAIHTHARFAPWARRSTSGCRSRSDRHPPEQHHGRDIPAIHSGDDERRMTRMLVLMMTTKTVCFGANVSCGPSFSAPTVKTPPTAPARRAA
jgi:hypothetical protein